jgi:hypothetical protein
MCAAFFEIGEKQYFAIILVRGRRMLSKLRLRCTEASKLIRNSPLDILTGWIAANNPTSQ